MARPPRIANRLPLDRATIYFLTFCVEGRKAVLANDGCWQACLDTLRRLDRWRVLAVLMMPDHVHMLASPVDREQSVSQMSKWFKRWFDEAYRPAWQWQEGVFDRLLRTEETASQKWRYIQENPVRRGLVARAEDWPYRMMYGPLDE